MERIVLLVIIITLLVLMLRQRNNLRRVFGTHKNIDVVLGAIKEEKMIAINEKLDEYQQEEMDNLKHGIDRRRLQAEEDYNKRKTALDDELLQLVVENEKRKKEVGSTFSLEIDNMEQDKEIISSALQDLRDKQEKTIVAIKDDAKRLDELEFHKIHLKKSELEDILELKKVEKLIHNKDVLRKLVYKTYIETPMNEMFNRLGIKTEPGIYKITNMIDKKVYIGQSTNVRNRLREHLKSAIGISSIAHQGVHEAMEEEGIENFTFHLIDECEREKLNGREKYWIDFYKSNEWGYNRTKGGA